ncbi:MAG: LysM peptidoglycan-binding domain-containing protein [Pirellulales bacterium]|nr:LysM peptidoglycan-binding domain-containing protein [Pirellulales bacterium]
MNNLKSVLMLLALVAVGYGVYRSLHHPEHPVVPGGADTANLNVDVQIGPPIAYDSKTPLAPGTETPAALPASPVSNLPAESSPIPSNGNFPVGGTAATTLTATSGNGLPVPMGDSPNSASTSGAATNSGAAATSGETTPAASDPLVSNNSFLPLPANGTVSGENASPPSSGLTPPSAWPTPPHLPPATAAVHESPSASPALGRGDLNNAAVPGIGTSNISENTIPAANPSLATNSAAENPALTNPATNNPASTNPASANPPPLGLSPAQAPDQNRLNPFPAASAPGENPAPSSAANPAVASPFPYAMRDAETLLQAKNLSEALELLTRYYDDPRLTPGEQQHLLNMLNQLAGTVIYSQEHWLAQPHVVAAGEDLEKIAQNYQVPWELLAKINGFREPKQVQPGQQLKVIPGPFRAQVNLTKKKLTLFLKDSYAGSFDLVALGQESQYKEDTYPVMRKALQPEYLTANGSIPGGSPQNPLGKFLLVLSNDLVIHGSSADIPPTDPRGSIRLSERDIEDVFDILSYGSRVTLRR